MKYYVVKFVTNTQGQDAPSVDMFPTEEKALVSYHNTLAAFHNAPDVLSATVSIQNEIGNVVIKELVDHTPEPEPEEEDEPVEE